MSEDPYLQPGGRVLVNKLGIRTAGALDRAERPLVLQRTREGVPKDRPRPLKNSEVAVIPCAPQRETVRRRHGINPSTGSG
jgi:hypothetical protein